MLIEKYIFLRDNKRFKQLETHNWDCKIKANTVTNYIKFNYHNNESKIR